MSNVTPFRTLASTLRAKEDLLDVAAKQYAAGSCTFDDLKVAAVEYTEALLDKAREGIGRRR